MAYSSKDGRRPFEFASKSSHHHVINNSEVTALVSRLQAKPKAEEANFKELTTIFEPVTSNPIHHVIAADGGYAEVVLEKAYPSRLMHFVQVGALYFRSEDLLKVEQSEVISPEDMSKLKNIERLKLALPTRNIRLKDETSLARAC